jgi:hypothetical protein
VRRHEDDLIELLHVSKQIRHSVERVEPSPGFRHHLRSDLAVALGVPKPTHIIVTQRTLEPAPPYVLLGAFLGALAMALAFALVSFSRMGRER